MLSVWLAVIPVAIGCFRYFFSPTLRALASIRRKAMDIGDRQFGKAIAATGGSPKAVTERILSAGSLCESVIPAFLKGGYSASYSIDALLSDDESDLDLSLESCDGISSPLGLTTTDGDINVHLAEKLLRSVVPTDIETVLGLTWQPPGDSNWLDEFPGFGHRSTPLDQSVERGWLTSFSLGRCRDSAREMISPQCGSCWTEESFGVGNLQGARRVVRTRATHPLSPWESPRAAEPSAGEIQEVSDESDEGSCTDGTAWFNLRGRLKGTTSGSVRGLDRDVLLMHPTVVIDTLVAVILGDSSSAWHRTAAADVLSWFSLHPNVSLRSDIRRRVVEAAVSAALGETDEIKRAGLRAIRNLLQEEDQRNAYAEAFVEDMYMPWVLALSVDPESVIYLNEILCSIEDNTQHSVSLLIGGNAMVATRKILSFLRDLMSDSAAASETAAEEHLVPCALSSLMRLMSIDVVEELCAGDDACMGLLIDAAGECAHIDGLFSQETAVGVIEKILTCSDASPMKETVYKAVVTQGGVASLFQVLSSGTRSHELAAINVLHRIHAWDSMVLASLIGVNESEQLSRVLSDGSPPVKRSTLLLIQKVWYQRMAATEAGMVKKVVGLIDDEDPKVRGAAACTLVTMVLSESPKKEISRVVMRNLVHLKPVMLSGNPHGVSHRLVADLLMRFLEGSDRGIQVSTIHMFRDIMSKLDLTKRINRRVLVSASRIFSALFRKEDAEMARALFDVLAEAGHQRPDVVADIIFESVPEIGHVWNLYDHMHLELSIETLQGFGRVLWQLRNRELQSRST